MGQDYRLKKLYEQIYSDKKAEPSSTPKNLQEAYKHVLTERTAFYAKDIPAGEEVPSIQGLESLGAVEEPQKIKHTIVSLSVLPALNNAMAASGWSAIKGVDTDRVAKDFVVAGVSGSDLEKITAHKKELTSFEESVRKPEPFNLTATITQDIKAKTDVECGQEELGVIFKRVFEEEGTIAGTAVGKGEVAISLFTNCSKGKTGDLLLPSGKTIEIKGKGGRLGPAEYSQANTPRDLAQFIKSKKQQTQLKFNRGLVVLKKDIKAFAAQLEIEPLYKKIFTDKLKETINSIADNIDNPDVNKFIEKAGLATKYPVGGADVIWKDFTKQGYIAEKPQEIPAASIEKDFVKETQNKIRKFFFDSAKGILKKGRLEKIVGKTVGAESLENQTFTIAVQNFFLNDLGLTPEEAAEAFLLTKSYNKDVSRYLPEIKEYFAKYHSLMIQGDISYLKAAVFAFQLSLYAHAGEEGQHFDYFMIMNNSSMNALALDVNRDNLFTYLASVYLNNSDKIEMSIRADGRQGASAVTLK